MTERCVIASVTTANQEECHMINPYWELFLRQNTGKIKVIHLQNSLRRDCTIRLLNLQSWHAPHPNPNQHSQLERDVWGRTSQLFRWYTIVEETEEEELTDAYVNFALNGGFMERSVIPVVSGIGIGSLTKHQADHLGVTEGTGVVQRDQTSIVSRMHICPILQEMFHNVFPSKTCKTIISVNQVYNMHISHF